MLSQAEIEKQLEHTIDRVEIKTDATYFQGKVRDCFLKDKKMVLVTSDRLSAFDRILATIPFKGQVLTQVANYWFEASKHIVPNHLLSSPHPNVIVTQEVEIIPVEVVVRGYLTGSAWRDYLAGCDVSGVALPGGMRRWEKFSEPIITPSTKAEKGEHDIPISAKDVVEQGIVEASLWKQVEEVALKLFAFGSEHAAKRGLILVDTKYEMGVLTKENGEKQLVLADEVHTPDSSRYWVAENYIERFVAGEAPEMLDKEFVRGPLIEQGYMGEGTPPEFSNKFRVEIAQRYIELYERLTGETFKAEIGSEESAIAEAVQKALL